MSIYTIIFYTLQTSGLLFMWYCYRKHKDMLRIEWDNLAKFIAFMFMLMAVRFSGMEVSGPQHSFASFARLPMVFWEDAFFALPIWWLKDHLKLSKWYWGSFAIASSLLFASLHLSYGLTWALCTLIYPYLLSYTYGKKYGFGTVMCAHILYDFFTLLTVKLFSLFPKIIMV